LPPDEKDGDMDENLLFLSRLLLPHPIVPQHNHLKRNYSSCPKGGKRFGKHHVLGRFDENYELNEAFLCAILHS
jgi:hypothetical protein